MIALKILRYILPPMHPLKYRWINYWFGKQANTGGWKDYQPIKNK
jgi:hypothetical protein